MNRGFKCLLDTFSWTKLYHLNEIGWNEIIDNILENNSIYITHDVKEELEYWHPNHLHYLQKTILLPILDIDYHKFHLEGFDKADASLIVYNSKTDIPVVTEDHPMLALSVVDQLDFIQLVDFFYILNELLQLSRNNFYKLVRILRTMKNITKKKERQLLERLK